LDVPIGSSYDIFNLISNDILNYDHIIFLLPSPKQELISELLLKYHDAKYYCFGGALNMLSGNELSCPNFISKLHLEFLWRLRNEPLRRIKRILFYLSQYNKIKKLNIYVNNI
jgi:UDP-N-acetyl-D-mannosaminuronic acid transferase (WecB/TagA/CpsF family)